MILLSALLASLTGLMVGEGHVAPAQVEVSAAPDLGDTSPAISTVAAAIAFEAPSSGENTRFIARVTVADSIAVRDGRFHLDMKQSWLI